ncbi:MAG: heme exporter protein CcmB [Nitrospinota bacterium]|nr:heme exporter protein CcmB [Nitrospinota bacterium]MDH5757467.1 heme exporter protein CcmB [Nitrospinota bacterium]
MGFFQSALIIAKKDLALELRGKEIVTTSVFFAILTILMFGFAFDMAQADGRHFAAGGLWVAILFSGALTMNRSFLYEKENDCLSAILLAPLDRSSIYFGKMGANFALMLVAEAFIVPVSTVIFNVNIMERFLPQLAVLLLGTLGFISVGTLVAAMSVNLRAREMLGPLLTLPVVAPALIASVEISSGLIGGEGMEQLMVWYKILVAFDLVYLVAPWLVFEKLVEQ